MDFTTAEQRCYEALEAARGGVASLNELGIATTGFDDESSRRSVKVTIHRMRKKGLQVTTVWGVGYRLVTS